MKLKSFHLCPVLACLLAVSSPPISFGHPKATRPSAKSPIHLAPLVAAHVLIPLLYHTIHTQNTTPIHDYAFMTSVAPPGPFQALPQQQPQQQTQSQPPQQPQGQSEISTLSWEGDKMCVLLPSLLLAMNNLDNRFNIYIYDYCFKRGYRKTARELLAEAEIPPDSIPPINARQGLLFECVLFSASSPIITFFLTSFFFPFLFFFTC